MVGGKRSAAEIEEAIGRQIRHARRKRKLSQEDLAEALELIHQQIQKYEKGVNRIASGTLFDIARILDKPISYFYGEYIMDPVLEDRERKTPGCQACLTLLQQFERPASYAFIEEFLHAALLREGGKR
ncbi:MAG: helix-turn-helix transcriptional regulator [Pseudomonadota bacterium]